MTMTWTSRTSGTTEYLNNVRFCNGLYITVGFNGTVLTSPDGVTWTKRIVPTTSHLYGIAYGNGKFVVSGESNPVCYSTNGIDWTACNNDIGIFDIIFANGIFVGVGKANCIYSSTDGVNWILRYGGGGYLFRSVVYGNGMFITVNSIGELVTSLDGITWNSIITNYKDSPNLWYANGLFVGAMTYLYTSNDGLNWVKQTSPSSSVLYGCVYAKRNFLVVSKTGGYIYSSTDGINWNTESSGITSEELYSICYAEGVTIVVGANGLIMTSGVHNTTLSSPTTIIHDATTKKTVNNQIKINWTTPSYIDGTSITYELSFFDGLNWKIISSDLKDLTYTHTLPDILYDTTQAKYRVRAYDGEFYSNYIESSSFELYIYQEYPPSPPSSITHNATTKKLYNQEVVISWGASTDENGDSITYDLYFFNSKNWVAIKGGLVGTTYTHTIPIMPILPYTTTNARYKVRAYDGELYGDFTESSEFEIFGADAMPPSITVTFTFN